MYKLFQFYEHIKKEFENDNYLLTCEELYNRSSIKTLISNHLNEMGFSCTPEMESTLFFSLVDIIVVVDKENDFYYATMSENKLVELKNCGRLVPRNDDLDFSKSTALIKSNNLQTINKYLSEGRFHFIKLVRLPANSFLCNITGMSPYPKITDERVYCGGMITSVYWKTVQLLNTNMYLVNDLVCTTSPATTLKKSLNNCPMDCKIRVKTLDGILEEVTLWCINRIDLYVESDKLRPLYTGVCKVNGRYVTLSRDILERFYGIRYLDFESKGVRIRYCLEELCGLSCDMDAKPFINKYRFYNDSDREILNCNTAMELRNVLFTRIKAVQHNSGYINARVLASPGQIYNNHVSYYMKIKNDADFEVVENIDDMMPQLYKVSGSTYMGYAYVEVMTNSFGSAESQGASELKRQFGSLYKDKVLGVQRGNVCKDKHKVYKVSIDTQASICQYIRWGYKAHYNDYAKLIRDVIEIAGIEKTVTDDMIQLLFINKLALEIGKSGNLVLEILGYHLEKFIHTVDSNTQEQLERKVENERKKLAKRGK